MLGGREVVRAGLSLVERRNQHWLVRTRTVAGNRHWRAGGACRAAIVWREA